MEKHVLLKEFPEYKDKIQELETTNSRFKELCDEYHHTEERIYRINMGEVVVIDEHAHELKTHLLYLKDAIYSYFK